MNSLRSLWNSTFFTNESPWMMRGVRVVLAVQALWLLLSRPDIPALVTWPRAFFSSVPPARALRFGIGLFPASVEWGMFALLHIVLLAIIFGRFTRINSAIAGLLLYHFAPFEEIIAGMPHTFFGGLTVPAVGLLILSVAVRVPREATKWSAEYRWPVALIQLLFSFNYFCAALAKFRFSHISWFTGENIRRWLVENWAVTTPPWSLRVAASPFLCWTIALATLFLETLFPLCVVSRTARRILVPLAFLGHIGIVYTLGITFPSILLLLLFVNWDWVALRLHRAPRGDEDRGGPPAQRDQELDGTAPA